jgi:hypothetical protein
MTEVAEPSAASTPEPSDRIAAVAAAVARAQVHDIPTYAPAAYARARDGWRLLRGGSAVGEDAVTSAISQVQAALSDAETQAAVSREALGDLVRIRTDMVRGTMERYYAPEILNEADDRYRLALERAEAGDVSAARTRASEARDLYRAATIRALERGPIARLDAAIANARWAATAAEMRAAQRELVATREVAASARRGETTVQALRNRIATARRRLRPRPGGIGRPGDIFDPGGGVFDPGGGVFEDPGGPRGPIDDPIAGAPDPVLTMRITDRTESSLQVVWLNPSPIADSHTLLRQEDGEGAWEPVESFSPSDPSSFLDDQLEPDRMYCYRVMSENDRGVRTTPLDKRTCGFTRDGNGIAVWRVQLRIRTADVSDASTGDAIEARLTSPLATFAPNGNRLWLDYGPRVEPGGFPFRDDFARDRDFTYDLDPSYVHELSDISMLTIAKEGTNAIGIAEIELFVNEVSVFQRTFGETSSTCLWIDEGDGHRPIYTVWLPELRAHPSWRAFIEMPHNPIFQIRKKDLLSRMEALVGDGLHGTEARWGEFSSPAWVEAERKDDARLKVDLDLEATAPIVEDPEVDINFDLRFAIACNQAAGTATLNITTENFDANVDFDLLTELFGTVLTGGAGVSLIENMIARRIEEAFQPIVLAITANTGGECPTIKVEDNGDLTFQV